MNIPVLVNNLGLLEQLAYWKVSAPCSAAGYNLTMKKHGYDPAHGLHLTCPSAAATFLFCCRSKFFSSNGLLREVNEVNKMNESLQAELQVRGGGRCLKLCVSPSYCFTRLFCLVLGRKRAETWRRVNVWWKRCRLKFQPSGDESGRRNRTEQQEVRWCLYV